MGRPAKKYTYLFKDRKYVDMAPVVKAEGTYDILFMPTMKGTGKTTKAIREGYINFQKTDMPFAYIRSTFEQLKEFSQPDKYGSLLDTLGWYFAKNEKISSKGHFKLMNRTKSRKVRTNKPICYFLSVNQAMNIQSSKFEKLSLMIFDEIQHHFNKGNEMANINKIINLIASVLRDHNCPIWFIFNNIDQNAMLLRLFQIERILAKMKDGQLKRVVRSFKIAEKQVSIKVLLYKPAKPKEWIDSQQESIGWKLSGLTDYGAVINSEDFVYSLKNLNYIKTLGNFKSRININGLEFGLWTYEKNGKEIYQFSRKFNKTGKVFYFSYWDFSKDSMIGSFDFLKRLKNKLIRKEIEFSDSQIFEAVVELMKLGRN